MEKTKGNRNNILSFSGELSSDKIKRIIKETELKLKENNLPVTTKSRLLYILVESMQNVYHHADKKNPHFCILLELNKFNEHFELICSNYISKEEVTELQNRLIELSKLSSKELKDLYLKQLEYGKLSEKGGAGLGLIEIARKSNKEFEFSFDKYNNELFVYELCVRVR
jgi:hypothetical protein